MSLQVGLAETEDDIRAACEVLLQLRPQYTPDTIFAQVQRQRRDGYHLACTWSGKQILCVAGFRIEEKLAWSRHIYVDDLVTRETDRSVGAGHAMIEWLKAHALATGCSQLHLDSGVNRFGAHRFYLREGFAITSHHFAIDKLGDTASP